MRLATATRQALAAGGLLLGLSGCVLPLEGNGSSASSSSSSSGYPGAGSGYTSVFGGNERVEYRGELPSGTYTESCRDMRVDRDRLRLEAECKRRDGRWRETRLDLRQCDRGIVNLDGWLACPQPQTVRLPPGSYRESCRDFSVEDRRLEARCRKKNGEWRDTQIDFSRCKSLIRNDDGRLVCS